MQVQRANRTHVWMQGPGGKRLLYTMTDGDTAQDSAWIAHPPPSVHRFERQSKAQKLSHTVPNAAAASLHQHMDAALSMLSLKAPPPPPPLVHAPARVPTSPPPRTPMRWYFATPRLAPAVPPTLPPLSGGSLPRPLLPLPFPPVASLPYNCPPYLYPAPRLPFKAPQSTPRAIAQRPAAEANPRAPQKLTRTPTAVAPKLAERSVPEVTRMAACNHQ